MTNNDWNTVDWDETPEDVDAVVTFKFDEPSYYKEVDGELQVQCYRSDSFECSRRREIDDVIEYFGDRFHLRPTPITKPTPVIPESTQVESSEVEATTAPEFDWSSVEEDVEAIILYKESVVQHLKSGDSGSLVMDISNGEGYIDCAYKTLNSRESFIKHYGDGTATLLRRPPAITPPEYIGLNIAYDTYTKEVERVDIDMVSMKGTIHFKPDADMYDIFKGVESKPSISTILQEAQQSILKHHGVTGEVKFIVTCS